MDRRPDKLGPLATAGAAAVALVCCGLPLLLASGLLGGAAAWFLDGGWRWLGLVPLAALAIAAARRRLRA